MTRALALPIGFFGLVGCSSILDRPRAAELPNPHLVEQSTRPSQFEFERVSTAIPFPRGLQFVDGSLYVLSRGRVRDAGGVDPAIDDKAGTIYTVDPAVAEPLAVYPPSPAVYGNAKVIAEPTSPPFRLLDRTLVPASKDRETDRPYCSLRYHEATKSFYLCAFSGIDMQTGGSGRSFSKNLSDGILRYDLRTGKWYEVERHDTGAGGLYPHHDPAIRKPPHGWLNGPDNCIAVGDQLYAVAKDNSRLVRYELAPLVTDPEAGAPNSHHVLGDRLILEDGSSLDIVGHSMLAERDGWLYVGTRTSSHIVRIRLDERHLPVQPVVGQLVAQFDPWDAEQKKSADLTDMVFDRDGFLYVVSAKPSRVYRFKPDPKHVYDARAGAMAPYVDFAAATKNPKMKSENVLVDDEGRVYVTSGDAYDANSGTGGAIYRATPKRG